VVLLDEADVFLEERSLADMQRNALVSGKLHVYPATQVLFADSFLAFLRVLEYYDGFCVPPMLFRVLTIRRNPHSNLQPRRHL
jgi:hypothetical protein